MKHGNQLQKQSSCKSHNMPCFQVVSYAFSRLKKKKRRKKAITCSFLIKASLTKVSNVTKWSTMEWFLQKPHWTSDKWPFNSRNHISICSSCTPRSCKDSWLARWTWSLWDSSALYLVWLWEPQLLPSMREGRFWIPK